jgi:flavin-binding protein dodecin
MTTVGRVTEITSRSEKSFDDAIRVGIERAHKTLRHVKSAWIKEQLVEVDEGGRITGYRINMLVTFILDD